MKKTLIKVALLIITFASISINAHSSSVYVPSPLFTHERSMVDSRGVLTVSADYAPIYQHSYGLLPNGWSIVFSSDRHALAPIKWSAGDRWVEVLNAWGKRHQANIMIDSATYKIVVTQEQTRRSSGVLFVNSANRLHKEMHNPENAYREVESHIHNRFMRLMGTSRDDVSTMQMQANLFHAAEIQEQLAQRVQEHEQAVAERAIAEDERRAEIRREQDAQESRARNARRLAGLEVDTPESWIERNGSLSVYSDGRVAYDMKEGSLREQITQMLVDSGRVSQASDVIWEVSNNHQWPNNFAVHGETFDHLIGRVLSTYRMAVIYRANNVAVIRYIERG